MAESPASRGFDGNAPKNTRHNLHDPLCLLSKQAGDPNGYLHLFKTILLREIVDDSQSPYTARIALMISRLMHLRGNHSFDRCSHVLSFT